MKYILLLLLICASFSSNAQEIKVTNSPGIELIKVKPNGELIIKDTLAAIKYLLLENKRLKMELDSLKQLRKEKIIWWGVNREAVEKGEKKPPNRNPGGD